MKYSKQQTIDEQIKELVEIENLYKANCVNWKGTTNDTNELYSEIIAHELLRRITEFENVAKVSRKKTYCRENHCIIEIDICKSNREEENFAKRITGLELENLGLIKDFQVPLKDTSSDTGLGKIDLISYRERDKILFVIELKYAGNKDTLLKALLEIYTYYKTVDKSKLVNDFILSQEFHSTRKFRQVKSNEIKIVPAVLLTEGCNSYDELEEMEVGQRPYLKALSLALGIKFFTIRFFTDEVQL